LSFEFKIQNSKLKITPLESLREQNSKLKITPLESLREQNSKLKTQNSNLKPQNSKLNQNALIPPHALRTMHSHTTHSPLPASPILPATKYS